MISFLNKDSIESQVQGSKYSPVLNNTNNGDIGNYVENSKFYNL